MSAIDDLAVLLEAAEARLASANAEAKAAKEEKQRLQNALLVRLEPGEVAVASGYYYGVDEGNLGNREVNRAALHRSAESLVALNLAPVPMDDPFTYPTVSQVYEARKDLMARGIDWADLVVMPERGMVLRKLKREEAI